VLLNIDFSGTVFTFVNICAPNDKRCRNNFFELINNTIEEESLGLKIKGDDFNNILNETGRYTHSNSRTKTSENLKNLIHSHSLCDIWKLKNINEMQIYLETD
jgi:hypothetical protein